MLAEAYKLAGNLDKAIEHGEIVVQSWETAMAVGNLSAYYMAKGLYQKAEDVCRSFLKDGEDNFFIHGMLCFSYLCRRQFDFAADDAEKGYLRDPQGKFPKGWFLLCKNDFAGAEKILAKDASPVLRIRGKFNEELSNSQQNLEKSKGTKKRRETHTGGCRVR